MRTEPMDQFDIALGAVSGGGGGRALIDYVVQSGWIGAIILVVSLFAAGLVFAQLFRLRRSRLAPAEHVEHLRMLVGSGRIDDARAWCASPDNESYLVRVFGAALVRCSRSAFGLLELRSAIEEASETELARLQRPTDGVQLVAHIAPMLGLLGTVVGMVGAFDAISVSELAQRSDVLAGHISAALVTTVLGLLVAIPTTAAYTYLRNRAEALAVDVGETIELLAASLEGVGQSGGAASARPVPQAAALRPAQPSAQPNPQTNPQPASQPPVQSGVQGPGRPRPVPRPSQPGAQT